MADNVTFIKQLQALSHNRFALNGLSCDEFARFYLAVLAEFGQPPTNKCYLIGTEGCHLCDELWQLIKTTRPHLINGLDIDYLELTDASSVLIDNLGVLIPIFLSPQKLLCYPFGMMDIMQLSYAQNE